MFRLNKQPVISRHAFGACMTLLMLLAHVPVSQAALTIGATRVVFDSNKRSTSVIVSNPSNRTFAVQTWVNTAADDDTTAVPFIPSPPLFRLNPGKEQQVQINGLPNALPNDRESLFYFNVQEIPQAEDNDANVLNIALRTRLKLFYRPSELKENPMVSLKDLQWSIENVNGQPQLVVNNPTPFHVSFSHYRYDPLNTVVGQDDEQRYYQDGELATRIQGEQRNTVMRANGNALAERQEGADPKYLMLASDQKNSVLCEMSQAGRKGIAYTAYGEAMVRGSLGYNGEARESQTGRYLLGNGYRAYNPVLMRFHSPDSLSPFEEGGLNSYMYCEGNPVDFVDPSGNRSFFAWLRDKLLSKSPKPIPKSAPKPTSKSAPNTATLVSSPAKSSKHESKPTFDNRGFNELPKWPTIWKLGGSQGQPGRTMVERMPSSTGQGSNLLGGFNGRDDVEFTSSRSPRANISKPSPKRRAKTQDPKAARTEKTVQQLRDEKWAANQKIEDIRRIEGRKQ
jgi:RHS repeat-associated protein